MFAVGLVFVLADWVGWNPGRGKWIAVVVLMGGGLFLTLAAKSKRIQSLIHGFLEDSTKS